MTDITAQPRAFAVFDGDLDADWAERYSHATALAVDTEAMGLIHGRDRLCLVQICDLGIQLTQIGHQPCVLKRDCRLVCKRT